MGSQLLTPSNLKSIKFELKGLNEYLEKVQRAGNDINGACKKAIAESAKPIFNDIEKWAEKHRPDNRTPTTLKGVNMSEPQQSGNYFYVDVGIDSNIEYNAWHAVFVEYGTPTNAADPGIRNAFYHNKNRVKKIQREVLQEEGMPID